MNAQNWNVSRFSTLGDHVDDVRPLIMSRSGVMLVDESGREYLDLSGGSHASCFVHLDKQLLANALLILGKSSVSVNGRAFLSEPQVELASVISSYRGNGSRVYFTSGGTESFETAIRIAFEIQLRRKNGRGRRIVARRHSYHGMSELARSVGDHPRHRASIIEGGLSLPAVDPAALGEPICGCADALEDLLSLDVEREIGVLVLEAVSGSTGGALTCSVGCNERLASVCRKFGLILVVDEVVTAFWRAGRALYSVDCDPDIVIGGKCLAGGIAPLGCVIISSRIADECRLSGTQLPLRLTFSGNPLACSVGLAVQRYVLDFEPMSNWCELGTFLGGEMEKAASKIAGIEAASVRSVGYLGAVHLRLAGQGSIHRWYPWLRSRKGYR